MSFLNATVTGKNNVHTISDVYHRGAKPKLTEYQVVRRVRAALQQATHLVRLLAAVQERTHPYQNVEAVRLREAEALRRRQEVHLRAIDS